MFTGLNVKKFYVIHLSHERSNKYNVMQMWMLNFSNYMCWGGYEYCSLEPLRDESSAIRNSGWVYTSDSFSKVGIGSMTLR